MNTHENMGPWPFFDPPETRVLTDKRMVERQLSPAVVRHVNMPGETPWQFLYPWKPSAKYRMYLSLSEMLTLDPSLKRVADLPVGWRAFRVGAHGEWKREELNPAGWPFKDPRDAEVFTSKEVLAKRAEAVRVVHDGENEWQFLPPEGYISEDLALETLETMYRLDSSIAVLGDLPLRWQATREARSDPWVRTPLNPEKSPVHPASPSAALDDDADWPYSVPRNAKVATKADVLEGSQVEFIAHLEDDTWLAVGDRDMRTESFKSATMEDLLSNDQSLYDIVRCLPRGYKAYRRGDGSWHIEEPKPAQSQNSVAASMRGTDKKLTAGICAILLGALGMHKFVLGYIKPGLIMLAFTLITCGYGAIVTGIVGIVEGIIYLTRSDGEFVRTYVESKKEWF